MTRRRLDADQSKNMILDAVERLLQREGHAGVNTRSVALEAGVKPPLVHYHFETTDNLLLESYRRSAARSEALLREALTAEYPLHAIWSHNSDPRRTALATQFMALAGHRQSIRDEMAQNVERFRLMQASALQHAAEKKLPKGSALTPIVIAALIAALGRAFVMETSIGVDLGHEGLRNLIDQLLSQIEPDCPHGEYAETASGVH